jgi:hypothetical protein
MTEGRRPKMRIAGIPLASAIVVAVAHAALAQGVKPAAAPAKPHATARPAPRKPASLADAGAPAPGAGATLPASPTSPAAAGVPNDAGVVEARTLDGGTRVFKFSELDIEGRLKSPQLVYFLRRVRAEFAAGDLGHRSFLREMSETRKESSF